MYITEHEKDRLLLFLAAELARKRRARGNLLNSAESYALIADEISEAARDGKNVSDLVSYGAEILTTDDVIPGVEHLVNPILVEAMFNDGQKLVCIHDPIREGARSVTTRVPGEIKTKEGNIILNTNKETKQILVKNKGDRPIQVGSHYHFFEVNPYLEFNRKEAIGYRLNIPAGTSVRFEPGDERYVELVSIGGNRVIHGLAGLTQGSLDDEKIIEHAMINITKNNYQDSGP